MKCQIPEDPFSSAVFTPPPPPIHGINWPDEKPASECIPPPEPGLTRYTLEVIVDTRDIDSTIYAISRHSAVKSIRVL
jgi:hypothetical protein